MSSTQTTAAEALPAILSDQQAAEQLQVTVRVLHSESRKGNVSGAFKVGRFWRYRRDALLGVKQ